MTLVSKLMRNAFITVALFFICSCDNRKDPYQDTDFLENIQVFRNGDVLSHLNERGNKYLYYDTLNIDSTLNYTYSSKYIYECSEQVNYNKEFGLLIHNTVENTIQFTPIKSGETFVDIIVTDPYYKTYEISLALTIEKI